MFYRNVICVVVCVALAFPALGQVSITASDEIGTTSSVDITPGDSFEIDVTLSADEPINGFSYWFTISDAGSGLFTISARVTPDGMAFEDTTFSDTGVVARTSGLLDPTNQNDLGATNEFADTNEAAGDYLLATFTIASDVDVPDGTYTLTIDGPTGVAIGDSGAEVIAITGGTYTINVSSGTTDGDTGGSTGGDTGSGDTTDGSTGDGDTTDDGSTDDDGDVVVDPDDGDDTDGDDGDDADDSDDGGDTTDGDDADDGGTDDGDTTDDGDDSDSDSSDGDSSDDDTTDDDDELGPRDVDPETAQFCGAGAVLLMFLQFLVGVLFKLSHRSRMRQG